MAFLPLGVLLRALAPHLSPALVSPPSWSRIEALAARIPPVFAWGIFECRLARGDERVDMLFRISGDGKARLAEALDDTPLWDPVAPFLRNWLAPGGPLAAVPQVWIEHDLLPSGPSAPFVQYTVDPGFPEIRGPRLAPHQVGELARAGMPLLLDEQRGFATLERCAEALPDEGRVLHVGAMPHRGIRDLRVIAAMPVAHVVSWLDAIGWPGAREPAEWALARIGQRFSRVSVQVDLGETVRPTLAFEYPLVSESGDDPGWTSFMSALVERGWSTADKADAARAWIGQSVHDLPDAPWLIDMDRQLDVKWVLRADGTCEAKAYLCFQPRYVIC